jgi:hypothetical protein
MAKKKTDKFAPGSGLAAFAVVALITLFAMVLYGPATQGPTPQVKPQYISDAHGPDWSNNYAGYTSVPPAGSSPSTAPSTAATGPAQLAAKNSTKLKTNVPHIRAPYVLRNPIRSYRHLRYYTRRF